MGLNEYLIQLGIEVSAGVASTAISQLLSKKTFTKMELVETLKSLSIINAEIRADNIIQFLAQKGDIAIQGTNIYSNHSIEMSSGLGTSVLFGHNSKSTTQKSSIETGHGAHLSMKNGGSIRQDKNGNIIFSV